MPRKSTHTRMPENEAADRTIRVEKTPVWQQIRAFFLDSRVQTISGILLLALALFLLIAYVSFLFTGSSDQSVLELDSAERVSNREEIRNVLGLPGALLADFLINGSFGIMSAGLIVMLVLFGIHLLHVDKVHPLRVFFCGLFWVLWGAVTFGFIQQMIHLGSFLYGGAVGKWSAYWLNSFIHPTGVIIVLVVTLVVFLIVSDPKFIPRTKHFGAWFMGLFKRKKKEPVGAEMAEDSLSREQNDSHADTDNPDDSEIIDLTGLAGTDDNPEPLNIQAEDIPLTIEHPSEEEPMITEDDSLEDTQDNSVDIDSEPFTDNTLNPGDTPLTIEQTKDVETVEQSLTPEQLLEKLGPYDPRKDLEFYKFPALDLLKVYDNETKPVVNQEEQRENGSRIVNTLRNYGIEIESIKATVGPTVTLYEIVPKAGIRIAKIQNLENDIMLSLSAKGIRIIAPMPGKGTVGIEVPNEQPQVVSMHSVVASKRFQEEKKMKLPVAIGRTITNEVFMFDLAKTPHLLVAGATGQGKSVAINAIITSLLYKKHPAELKFVMVDPKMVEFAPYKPLIKHYLAAMPETEPNDVVITDCDKVVNVLNSLVIEMENRYKLLMDAGVRNLEDYNEKFVNRRLNPQKVVADSLHHQFLPYIVIIIDEYGDFIMQAGKQVETPIARITQKARAVGMHMILATQRPSVNIVTGVIKANIPTRIALRTQSVVDSRTVLDAKGADQLIGRGDMLYSGNGDITRIQCAFVDTPEVDQIVEHIEKQQHYTEPYQLPEYVPEGGDAEASTPGSVDMKRLDPMFADVARYVVTRQEGSTSRLQRAFEIGYNRAGKLSDQLEAAGIVGPNKGPKGRDVLISDMDALESLLKSLNV